MHDTPRSDTHLPADGQAEGGTRSSTGSNYGDFVPAHRQRVPDADPSRGAELERDVLPDDADFSKPTAPPRPTDR